MLFSFFFCTMRCLKEKTTLYFEKLMISIRLFNHKSHEYLLQMDYAEICKFNLIVFLSFISKLIINKSSNRLKCTQYFKEG